MLPIVNQIPYFNKITLGEILGKRGENLNYWIKKLLKNGEVFALKKGLYVSKPYLLGLAKNPDLKKRYLEYLANIIRYPSYISLEYALSEYGAIPEGVYAVTSITLKTSRIYSNELGNFIYKNIKSEFFNGFEFKDFEGKRIKFATKAKALFDFLYLGKWTNTENSRINWDVFNDTDRNEFAKIVNSSDSPKMKKILEVLKW
ncbi:MAG: hypothetical protein A3I38_02315 [Candidatus Wildermuthbacteria bacterium RIFCSPLOWO2_02_FULL_47_10]|uniref:AbiEi antitoxin C-terminal domain-containing protein n=1 Tax=Candidatus Wildermuthbacteria bacterium RIFCSPHIGHO2_02_FULL_47_17 TaxID=1802452 RepID=A0A1G2R7E3_9BACT|nr:MAG: hypothetical protein A3D59_01125 [Candidatus Wildermuthbacteria bacterium RIFCSPHIGHO2_02_FULL_47_17]OHA75697.1 MAG: hypothetical protein A3I38_02315 [Candidatus Wildermuthbacteria bacterium RIFCSPLOWO2_02_FULL_47_10]